MRGSVLHSDSADTADSAPDSSYRRRQSHNKNSRVKNYRRNFFSPSLPSAVRPVRVFLKTVSGDFAVALLCFALFAATSVNLAKALGLPLASAAVPALIAAAAVGTVRILSPSRAALFKCLAIVSAAMLLAVALVLAFPAWQLIMSGGSSLQAGAMAPLFVSALALYVAALWLESAGGSRRLPAGGQIAALISGPGLAVSLVASLVMCSGFLLGLEWWSEGFDRSGEVTKRFLERGIIPPATALLFFWAMLLLAGKAWNVRTMRRLKGRNLPAPKNMTAANELIKNLWQRVDESYLIPRYIAWAVPVLGFIGTVLGISLAADGIRGILSAGAGFSGMSGELGDAIAPLGIAFDTTLIALSLSVILMLALTLVQRSEEAAVAEIERRLRNNARN